MAKASRAQPDILQAVRAAFILNGSSLGAWCRENEIDPARAWRALQGKNVGPVSERLRARILAASSQLAA